jgi:hypothetical protein
VRPVPTWIRLLGLGVWTAALVVSLLREPTWPDRADESIVDSVVFLDPFSTSVHAVDSVHKSRRSAVCVLRAGVWEPDRPDATRFAPTLRGSLAHDGGRWLDIRAWALLAEPLSDRLALCAAKGFDGVLLTHLDGWVQPTGFPLSHADQIRFNTAMVGAARRHGLRVSIRPTPLTPLPNLE